jgi:hypothetical protein
MADLSVYELDVIIRTVIKAGFETFWQMPVEDKDLDPGGGLHDVMEAADAAVMNLIDKNFLRGE